ncbi:MAG: histidine kinase, partial [Chitinophagia bacterium]|nr:histidine kinase [Chitinophagia bacterium]
LLDFSRISNTQQPFEFVNLTVAMREVKTDLELVIEETGTTLEFTSLPVIEAVYSQMKQLFTNIVSNAIKFHKEGVPPVINITSGPVDRDEVLTLNLDHNMYYEKITITDNGIGFEPEYAQRIFHVFQRLHGRSEYPGTGIGLAICKKIVEYHKGFIHAESSPGMGASFFIIIPSSRQTPVTNANEP